MEIEQVPVKKKRGSTKFKVLSIVIVLVLVIGLFISESYIEKAAEKVFNQLVQDEYSVKLSGLVKEELPKNLIVPFLMFDIELPLNYRTDGDLVSSDDRFIDLPTLKGFEVYNEGISEVVLEASSSSIFGNFKDVIEIDDIEIDYEVVSDIDKILSDETMEVIKINLFKNAKIERTFLVNVSIYGEQLEKLRALKSMKTQNKYDDSVYDSVRSLYKSVDLEPGELLITSKEVEVAQEAVYWDLIDYTVEDGKFVDMTEITINGMIGKIPYSIEKINVCDKNQIKNVYTQVENYDALVKNDYPSLVLELEETSKQIVYNALLSVLISDNFETDNYRDVKSKSLYDGILSKNQMHLIVGEPTLGTLEDVYALIFDEDIQSLNPQERRAMKDAIDIIPMALWQDVLMDYDFNVRLWENEAMIKRHITDQSAHEEYLNEVSGVFFGSSASDPTLLHDIFINMVAINKNYRDGHDFSRYFYTMSHLDSSYDTVKINSVQALEDYRMKAIKSTFIHELGHFFDYENNLLSEQLFENWRTTAKKIYSSDHYYTSEEFFAESFANYYGYPESLKRRSEETYKFIEDLFKNYKSEEVKALEFYLENKSLF